MGWRHGMAGARSTRWRRPGRRRCGRRGGLAAAGAGDAGGGVGLSGEQRPAGFPVDAAGQPGDEGFGVLGDDQGVPLRQQPDLLRAQDRHVVAAWEVLPAPLNPRPRL